MPNNPFFNNSPGSPMGAPMTPNVPRQTGIGRTNAVTPSLDPQSLRSRELSGITPQMLNDPQFLALFQQYMAQMQGGMRGGMPGGNMGGPGAMPTGPRPGGFSGSLMPGAPKPTGM